MKIRKYHNHVNKQLLERSKKMADILNKTAVLFLSGNNRPFEEIMTDGVTPIADMCGLGRVSVWRNFDMPDTMHTSQIYRWDRQSGGTTKPTPGLEDVTYEMLAPRWKELLPGGECINGPVRSMPESDVLRSFGVMSAFIAPIFIGGGFWGFVLFEDRVNELYFDNDSAEMMTSAALLFANAVLRAEMEHEIINTNTMLKQALDKATAASEAKGLFLSNMSHEMRTPLNTIMGMASIGKNAPDTARKDYALGKIAEASAHLLGVINDVLDMSKIEANKLELVLADFSFERMLKKAVNAVSFRAEQKSQKFFVNIDGKIPHTLAGDDQRLAQVVINLLSNAIKFTPENGSIHLSARLLAEEGGVCAIVVEVADTGIGISPEQQQRLFNAFEQADGGTSRKFGGTGLGLAISKRIIEMMQGEISVSSKLHEGSVFTITFKMRRGGKDTDSLLDPSVNWGNVTVLVVDDTPDILSYFTEIFKISGVACDVAESGEAALKLIEEKGGYDIYFVDWKMPGMDGIELSKKIKGRQDEKSVVIMISAMDWDLIRDNAHKVIDKYLMKPLFASNIIDCMNACLGTSGVDAQKAQKTAKTRELVGCNILLAEDVLINREILIASMEDTGVVMDCAENGLEALQMLSENPDKYDLIFMDVQMPEMDGLTATRKIRESGNNIPIIAMTANVFREDIEKCLSAGMDDHIGKPLDMEAVMEKVRKYWQEK